MLRMLMGYMMMCLSTLNAQVPEEQWNYPQDYFRSPLDIPLVLSGNFGEPRTTHFHAGLDFKTQGRENLNIYAAADGYVSRIKVSPWGYGNALYITHPNGYVTVYGHLNKYSDAVTKYIKENQYKNQSFSVELFPEPGELTVSKGDVVALSGNTGSSGGPHLHFEIRDSLERPINPLHFGIAIKDDVKPFIGQMSIYPLGNKRFLYSDVQFNLKGAGAYYTTYSDTLLVNSEQIGLALQTFDQQSGATNKNGIYGLRMYANGELMYHMEMEKFSFSEGRYVLSQVDAELRDEKNLTMHRCYTQPGNKLSTYKTLVDNGVLHVKKAKATAVTIEVYDFAGNVSRVKLHVKYDPTAGFFKASTLHYATVFSHEKINTYDGGAMQVSLPYGTLFDTLYFDYSTKPGPASSLSDVHILHYPSYPAFDYYQLSIWPRQAPYGLTDKMLIVHRTAKGSWIAQGGSYENGKVSTDVRSFGEFFVTLDTIAPVISAYNISEGKNMSGQSSIRMKATDNLAGIESYNAYIDGKWVLMQYEPKQNLFYHDFEDWLEPGEHEFVFKVTDERQNSASYSVNFKY